MWIKKINFGFVKLFCEKVNKWFGFCDNTFEKSNIQFGKIMPFDSIFNTISKIQINNERTNTKSTH